MTSKIFRSILSASVLALIAALAIITGILYDYFEGLQQENLKAEYTLAATAVENSGYKYLSDLNSDDYRLTWVATDGTVLYDTTTDASKMENHIDREEIEEALNTGIGESERYSTTLTEKTLYYAGVLSDGSILRISSSHASVLALLVGLIQPILIVFILLLIISILLANRMSKRIVEPLNKLNLENPLENNVYEELSPLLRRINSLQGNVRHRLAELKQKNDEFNQIIGSMSEGLVLLDKNGVIISINNAAMSLFATDNSCIGENFLTVDRSTELQKAFLHALSDGHAEIRAERDGREYQYEISRIESDGKTIGTVLLSFDVTEKTFAERNRREFTANVSHELKTPLQSITGSAELIENGLVKPEDMPRFIGHIRSEAARLVALIEDIIRLSQLDEEPEMPHENTDLFVIATDTVNELKYSADAKKITLTLSGESVELNGVKKLLSEIVFNLCDNAVKYTENGGKVTVDVHAENGNAVLTVSDNGIGIPPEHQSRIFERFYRVDKSHSKESGGTGLGLSIVKHAVQYHHGNIKLISTVGKGSKFIVNLPLI